MRTRELYALGVLVLTAACASTNGTATGSTSQGEAIVLRAKDLAGSLLESMKTHIPSMRIVSSNNSNCPRILFRAQRSGNNGNPTVYIDGTQMLNTCAVSDMPTVDIDSVEIYVSGISSRPTLQRNPAGIILIYRRRE